MQGGQGPFAMGRPQTCGGPQGAVDTKRMEGCPSQCEQDFLILCITLWSLQYGIMHCVSLGVAQHIAGNVLYEMVYGIMDQATKVGIRIAEIWSLVREAYGLDNATTRLGTLTKTMSVDKDASRRHHPMLRCKAKRGRVLVQSIGLCVATVL